MSKAQYAEQFTNYRWLATDNNSDVRYVRELGDDTADGLTSGTAWATLERALAWLPNGGTNMSYTIDLGGEIYVGGQLGLGHDHLGGVRAAAAAVTNPDKFNSRRHVILRAALQLVETVTISVEGEAWDPTTGYSTYAIDETISANALVGHFIAPSASGAVVACVKSNTAGGFVTTERGLNGTVYIYTYGARLSLDANGLSFFRDQAASLGALCDWRAQGIYFQTSDTAAAISISGLAGVEFYACRFAGAAVKTHDTLFDVCYFQGFGQYVFLDASAVFNGCMFKQIHVRSWTNWSIPPSVPSPANVMFKSCTFTELQSDINSNEYGQTTIQMRDCAIDGCGLQLYAGNNTIEDCAINEALDDCVRVWGKTMLVINGLRGGNSVPGFGINILDGATVTVTGTVDITGTSGNFNLGAAGPTTWGTLSGAGDLTDLAAGNASQLVRIGQPVA